MLRPAEATVLLWDLRRGSLAYGSSHDTTGSLRGTPSSRSRSGELAGQAQVGGGCHGHQGLHRAWDVYRRREAQDSDSQRHVAGPGPRTGASVSKGAGGRSPSGQGDPVVVANHHRGATNKGVWRLLGWLAKKREVREIEVQFAACTIQAFWSDRAPSKVPLSPKKACLPWPIRGSGNKRWHRTVLQRSYQHMYDRKEACRRLEAVQARLKALGKARVPQCRGY